MIRWAAVPRPARRSRMHGATAQRSRRPACRRRPVAWRVCDGSAGGGEARGDDVPVDDVPPRVDVVGAAVLVEQVVGVLPDVDAQQRRLALRDRVVLVGRARPPRGPSRRGPARPSRSRTGRRPAALTLRLEVGERAERGVDRVGERAARLAAARAASGSPRRASGCNGRRRCCGPRCACPRARCRATAEAPRSAGPRGRCPRAPRSRC